VTAPRLRPVDRRRTVAEPAEEAEGWWELFFAVLRWQETLPAADDHRRALPCTHCEHCGGKLVHGWDGDGTWSHLYASAAGERQCRYDLPSDLGSCFCVRWANAVYAYRLACIEAAARDAS
jgi:hypothetical protein